jgi:hypothetical protein
MAAKKNPAQRAKARRGSPLRPGRKYNKAGQVVRDPNRARVKKRTSQARRKVGPYSVKPRPRSTTQPSLTPRRTTTSGRVSPIRRAKSSVPRKVNSGRQGSRGGSRAPVFQRHEHR